MADAPLNLLLIDCDPILRLGLQAALEAMAEVRAIASCETLALGTVALAEQRQAGRLLPDVVLVNLTSAVAQTDLAPLAAAVNRYRGEFPDLPLFALEHRHPTTLGRWARQQGFMGYWARERSLKELVEALGWVAQGRQVWTLAERRALPLPPLTGPGRAGRRLGLWDSTVASGLRQVEQQLAMLDQQRRQAPWGDRLWIDGVRRELRASRWLLRNLSARAAQSLSDPDRPASWSLEAGSSVPLAQPQVNPGDRGLGGGYGRPSSLATAADFTEDFIQDSFGADAETDGYWTATAASPGAVPAAQASPADGASVVSTSAVTPKTTIYAGGRVLQTQLLEQISLRMPPGLVNLSGEPQEIDILNGEKRQELLSTVMRCFGELLLDLRLSNLTPEQLPEQRQRLLLDWWSKALGDFLGKYSTLMLPEGQVALLPILLAQPERVSQAIFDPIPGVETVFATLLFGQSVAIDGVPYRPESPEASMRLVQLTENLLIQMANGVVQPLLNNFADVDAIKQSFYDKRLLSTREIEKFRNNLSWKYRVTSLFREAQDIYESRYGLLNFVGATAEGQRGGIERVSFYAPRRAEMVRLNPFQQTVTLALEVRDAVAPQLEVLAVWLGSSVVYLLTEVVGRGIGLIGRGVIQGVGSSIKDVRKMRRGSRDEG